MISAAKASGGHPRAVIKSAVPSGGAAASITWGLRAALAQAPSACWVGMSPSSGMAAMLSAENMGGPPAASARVAPAAPPPPGE